MKVDRFTCTVRLGGNLLHEVNKEGITSPELKVLRNIHGGESIVNVKRTESVEVDEMDEHYRLARIYGKERIEKVLVLSLDDYDTWLQMEQDREVQEREAASQERQRRFNEERRLQTVAAMNKLVNDGQPAAAEPEAA